MGWGCRGRRGGLWSGRLRRGGRNRVMVGGGEGGGGEGEGGRGKREGVGGWWLAFVLVCIWD